MARTQVPGHQVRDGGLTRDDMNILTAGEAMITRLLAGSGVVLSETGGESGTGEVTVGLTTSAEQDRQRIDATFSTAVPGTGSLSLGTDNLLPFTVCGFIIAADTEIHQAGLVVSKVDPDNAYALRIYSDPTGTPVLVHTLVTLPTNTRIIGIASLDLALPAGEYGLFIERTSGNGKSKFKSGYGMIAFG